MYAGKRKFAQRIAYKDYNANLFTSKIASTFFRISKCWKYIYITLTSIGSFKGFDCDIRVLSQFQSTEWILSRGTGNSINSIAACSKAIETRLRLTNKIVKIANIYIYIYIALDKFELELVIAEQTAVSKIESRKEKRFSSAASEPCRSISKKLNLSRNLRLREIKISLEFARAHTRGA